jgi:biotin operon repressor
MPDSTEDRKLLPEEPASPESLTQPTAAESPHTADGAVLLARIRAVGSTSADKAASTIAAASRAAGQIDRQLIEVAVPGGTRRILALGWAEGAAPDPGQHPSASPRQLSPVQLLTWATCLAAAWPRAEADPYPGRPFRREDILRACIGMGAHDRTVVAALRILSQAGMIRFTGPVGWLGPAAAALPNDTWSALRRMHDRLPHAALQQHAVGGTGTTASDEAETVSGARRLPGPPAGPVSIHDTLVRAAVTALENAQGPVARSDLSMLADPAIRHATENALAGCGRNLILTPEGSWTTGYPDHIAKALAREQAGTLGKEQRAVLALVLLRAVAIPRAQGLLDGAWTSSSHPVTLDELAANRPLSRTKISDALQGLRAAGYIASTPSGGYILGPAMARLSPAGVETLWEDLIVLARPNGYMAERIRARRSGTSAVDAGRRTNMDEEEPA